MPKPHFPNRAVDRLSFDGLSTCLTLKREDGWEIVMSTSAPTEAMLALWPAHCLRTGADAVDRWVSVYIYRSPRPGYSVQDLLALAWTQATRAIQRDYPEGVDVTLQPELRRRYQEEAPRALAALLRMSAAELEAEAVLFTLERG